MVINKEEAKKLFDAKAEELQGMQKKLIEASDKLKGLIAPKSAKECLHNGKPIKVILTMNGDIIIKFSENEEADKFYNELGK